MTQLLGRFGLLRGDTIGSVLARNRGLGPGFDLMRLLLAATIFYTHAKYIAGGGASEGAAPIHDIAIAMGRAAAAPPPATQQHFEWDLPIKIALVPMFFALSGFLVAGSAIRLRKVPVFLSFRALRILPALVMEVTLSALVLGTLLTDFPLSRYFSDPLFWHYFSNIAGIIQFELPGVFLRNPAAGIVNINLWTLPGEFYCYLAMAVCMLTGLVERRRVLLGLVVVVTILFLYLSITQGFSITGFRHSKFTLAYYFLVGVVFYQWRERIPVSLPLFLAAGMLSYGLLAIPKALYIAPAFLVYCTVFLGMLRLPRAPLIHRGDYSYGIYLYGFPICQACVTVVPALLGHTVLVMLVGGLATTAFAVFSWHVVEKPALRLKTLLPARWFPSTSAPAPA